MVKQISERGALRLVIAAGLLSADPRTHGGLGVRIAPRAGKTLEQVTLEQIKALNPDQAAVLKSHVDWVEAYELGDAIPEPARPKAPRPMSPAPRPVPAPVQSAKSCDPFIPVEDSSDEDAVLQALASVSAADGLEDPPEETDPTSCRVSERA